jgi:hypothetical protein
MTKLYQAELASTVFLRRVLWANALFSTAVALLCLAAAAPLANLTGLQPPAIFLGLGLVILPFAAAVAWVAQRAVDNLSLVRTIFFLDVGWVAVSLVLLLGGWLPLTAAGWWAVVLVADVVALLAVLEYVGLRRAGKAQGGLYGEPTRA